MHALDARPPPPPQAKHGIDAIFKEILYELILASPEDPVQYATDIVQYGVELAKIVRRRPPAAAACRPPRGAHRGRCRAVPAAVLPAAGAAGCSAA
jgi:hypothetical protein